MTPDTLNAVIMRLQSSAVECFEAIKDRTHGVMGEGDVDFIAQQAMRLANLEGALITLQQYTPNILQHSEAVRLEDARLLAQAMQPGQDASVDAPTAESEPITEEELWERSSTFRRSTKGSKKKASSKRRTKKDE